MKNFIVNLIICLMDKKKFLLFILIALIKSFSFSQNFDIYLLRQTNLNRNTNLDKSLILTTHTAAPLSISTPIILFTTGVLLKDNLIIGKSIYSAETILISNILSTSMKYLINRERPFIKYPELQNITRVSSPSFPSGHTSTAFALATSLSLAFPKWYVIVPSFLWAGLVAYSRLHLGVHYPSDIIAGIIVGCGSAFLSIKINYWINKKYDSELIFYR
ncbi:MAG: phosphatase PAP2 family protein [Endomicrobiia bacterium]